MSVINQIKTLLGMEVKLEQMKLVDGVTIVEADSFEAGMEIFIVTEDEQKIALPIGSYEMENGFVLVVEDEGIIASYMEAPAEEEEVVAEPEAEVEVEAQAEQPVKKTVESIVKETFFSEIEALKQENIELKAQLEKLSEQPKEEVLEVELAEEPKPISFNPENESPSVNFKFGQNRPMSTLDRVMSKINS